MQSVRLLIAERAAMRAGIQIGLAGRAQICAEAGDAQHAIRAAKREQPDVCLVGRDIPGGGLAAVRGICRAAPESAVVMLAEISDADDLLDAVRAGAVGYVPGGLDAARLGKIVDAIQAKEAIVPRALVLELLLELRGGARGALTQREAQVLAMLRRGHSTASMAERLNIKPVTVRRHISGLVHKLGVENRAALPGAGWWGGVPPGASGTGG
jgi:DNA-binding NarL/FixJ family response regulator